ncbi:beclin-1 [Galendromus occidentalis]|uniref:Beclin-1 n=1 Tax=Galendromus occidentalis TaxID=34638 RepID=A0AAJ6W076_9ACAR|nr:beclin-1 [Galendromus occidentalis]
MTAKTEVSYCEKCSVPLDFGNAPSIEEDIPINPCPAPERASLAERRAQRRVLGPLSNNTPKKSTAYPTGARKKITPYEAGGFSQHMETTARLKEVLRDSENNELPMCRECVDTLMDFMQEELDAVEKEVAAHKTYLDRLGEPDQEGMEELRAQLEKLHAEERELDGRLSKLQTERDLVFKQRDALLKEKERLEKLEKVEFRNYMLEKELWFVMSDKLTSTENRLEYAKARLMEMKNTSVFDSSFRIRREGALGMINGFRLGKPTREEDAREWWELSMAWGQLTQALFACAKKLDFTLDNYALVPYGDKSYIVAQRARKKLPLYHSIGTGQLFNPEFDSAMEAFLDCLQQFEAEIRRQDRNFTLLHPISGSDIGERDSEDTYSIRYYFNCEEEWNKALRCVMMNVSQILRFVSAKSKREEEFLDFERVPGPGEIR